MLVKPEISKGDVVKMANGFSGEVIAIIPRGMTENRVMVMTEGGTRFTVPSMSVTILAKFYNC